MPKGRLRGMSMAKPKMATLKKLPPCAQLVIKLPDIRIDISDDIGNRCICSKIKSTNLLEKLGIT